MAWPGLVVPWFVATLAAQTEPPPKTEAELDQRVVAALVGFARSADTWKSPTRARRAWQQILDHYDSDNASARAGLGQKRVKGEWQVVTPPAELPKDAATPAQKKQVDDAWRIAAKRVAALHKGLAQTLDKDGHRAQAIRHFERSLSFQDDVECHRALGHVAFDGFHGTAEQIAFVQRLRAIFAKARDIAAQPIDVEAVPADLLPPELRPMGIEFAGARSKHVTYWVAGSAAAAAKHVAWNERALLLLEFLFGDDPEANKYLRKSPRLWVAVLRTKEQRDQLLVVSPVTRDGEPLDRAKLVGGTTFPSGSGHAEWVRHRSHDNDHAVGHATKRGTPWCNSGLSEGLVHVATWLLCGTMESSYMQLASTEAGDEEITNEAKLWIDALREEIELGEDWPLVQVPRERMSNFRNSVRVKAWSFMTWLLARHPDRWVRLLVELGHEPKLPEEVAALFEKVLERPLGEVEAEWREWARAGSRIGKASGLPQ